MSLTWKQEGWWSGLTLVPKQVVAAPVNGNTLHSKYTLFHTYINKKADSFLIIIVGKYFIFWFVHASLLHLQEFQN